jgi:hypothetical protein
MKNSIIDDYHGSYEAMRCLRLLLKYFMGFKEETLGIKPL